MLTRPAVYTLQDGEFPYCIARRFNVDPHELLWLNGLNQNQAFYSGLILRIPQTDQPFPGERALRPHPAAHIIKSGETLHSIACYYGDIDPLELALFNGLSPTDTPINGQILVLPPVSRAVAVNNI